MSSRHHFAPLHYILWLLLLYVPETGRHELFGYLSGSGLTHLLHILRVVENSVQLQNSAGGDPLIFLEFQWFWPNFAWFWKLKDWIELAFFHGIL
jgi:hypothetical protein